MADPKISGVTVSAPVPASETDLREMDRAKLGGLTGRLYDSNTVQPKNDVYFSSAEDLKSVRDILDSGHRGRIRVINFDQGSHDGFFTAPLDYIDGLWYACLKATAEEQAMYDTLLMAKKDPPFHIINGLKVSASNPQRPDGSWNYLHETFKNGPNKGKEISWAGWYYDDLKYRVTPDGKIQFIPTLRGENMDWNDPFHQITAEGASGVGQAAFDALKTYLDGNAASKKEDGVQIKSYYDAYLDQYAEVKKQLARSSKLAAAVESTSSAFKAQIDSGDLTLDFAAVFATPGLGDLAPNDLWDVMARNGWLAGAKSLDAAGHKATFATQEDALKFLDLAVSGAVTLDFTNAVDGIDGGTDEDAMVAMIRFGWLKSAIAVDVKKHTATFANHKDANIAIENVFRTDKANYAPKGFADPLTKSISFYFNDGAIPTNFNDGATTKDDAYLSTSFVWGLWNALTPAEEKAALVASTSPLGKLEFPHTDAELPIASLETELKRQEELDLSPQAFLYFTIVKNDRGQPVLKLITRQELLDGAEKPIPMPVQDAKTLLSVPISSEQIPSQEELQNYIDTHGLNNLRHTDLIMGTDTNYAIVPDDRYLFKTRNESGQEVFLIRVPTCNRDPATGQIALSSAQETAPLGFLNVDEATIVSSFIGNLDPQGKSMMMSRLSDVKQEVYNPLTKKSEVAFGYSLSILGSNIPDFVPDTIRALIVSGYPIELPANATDKQVIEAAAKFFLNGWKTGEDFKWYLPGTSGFVPDPFTNDYYELNDPRAWADPEGKMEPILGPDGNPVLDDDKKPLMRPKTVSLGGMDISRKRAAYLVYMFLAYMGKADEFGMTTSEMREWQAQLNQTAIQSGKDIAFWSTLGMIALSGVMQAWAIREQRKLMKEAQNMGVNDKNDQEEISKLMTDPNYMPSFVSPLLDLSGSKDPSPYFANPERDQQIRMLMRSLTGETGYSAAFLTGDAGVGKTEMMKEVQRRLLLPRDQAIAAGVPEELIGKIIYNVDPSAMGANIKFIGTFEGKVALLKMFARNRNAILFFDEAKMYVDMGKAGDGDGGKSGNTLFELCLQDFSNKTLRAVFATTTTEYNSYFLTNPDLKAFLRRVKEIRLKAYGSEDVKLALASIYPSLLEDKQIIRFDMTGAREVTVRNADGTTKTILIPKFIEDVVNMVANTEDVLKNPNLLMDYSIKKLKEIADLALTDFANGHLSFILAENVDGRLPLLIKRKQALQAEIKGYESELTPLKDGVGREGTVFGYNVLIYSRFRRRVTAKKIAELEALITAKKAELKQVEDDINTISGDPNLIPIYESRLTDTQNTIDASQALLNTANMTKAQRDAAMQAFTALFGEPNGQYFKVISRIHVLNNKIRTLLAERESLLKPIIAELALLPSEKWDETIRAKLGVATADRVQAIETQLEEELIPQVTALENDNQDVMQQHELLLYQSGQKTLSPLEIARYKKTIAELEKKKAKYEEKLAQLRSAAAHIAPGKPQGIVMGGGAFEHYYPRTVTNKDDGKEPKLDPALVEARTLYSAVVPDFEALAETASNPAELAKSFYTYISGSADPKFALIKAEYVQLYRWLYDLDPATGRPLKSGSSPAKALNKAREHILQAYIVIRGQELESGAAPKPLSTLPIASLTGLPPELARALTGGFLQAEAAAAKMRTSQPVPAVPPRTAPPVDVAPPPVIDPLADVKAHYATIPGIAPAAFAGAADQAALNRALYDSLEPLVRTTDKTSLRRFASEYRALYRTLYEKMTSLDLIRDAVLREITLVRLAELQSGAAPKSLADIVYDVSRTMNLDRNESLALMRTAMELDTLLDAKGFGVEVVAPSTIPTVSSVPASLAPVLPLTIHTGPVVPSPVIVPAPIDPSAMVADPSTTLPSTSNPKTTPKVE
jgi:hypothetical protein